MELTKTKLHKIIKRYKRELEKHEESWANVCRKHNIPSSMPTIYDHEKHNSKGNQLFKGLITELVKYEIFPKTDKN